jgi:hypothetical protein
MDEHSSKYGWGEAHTDQSLAEAQAGNPEEGFRVRGDASHFRFEGA